MTINVRDYNVIGDGINDDTDSFQAALDAAFKLKKTLFVPSGKYSVGELYVPAGVYIKADYKWGFGNDMPGDTILLQRSENQRCILNMKSSSGATIDGLTLYGNKQGNCCGIITDRTQFPEHEDSFRIQNCKICHFGGSAVSLNKIWCFSVRHNMFSSCGKHGIEIEGWDGFILDNWFSCNTGAGIKNSGNTASVTMTGNRIEWNGLGGICIDDGNNFNITGNYIDRSGQAGINISNFICASITGNIIYRSGARCGQNDISAHCILKDCDGINLTGNSFMSGCDDGNKGRFSPETVLKITRLRNSIVSNNVMPNGSLCRLIDDDGGHENCIINNNVGCLRDLSKINN
ncbi:MAG: right-handed parallel beta-helix repeat-containing protein [bacterium]|nr:right-handed parallel beta-helix repeat-containing protein [bacterium]